MAREPEGVDMEELFATGELERPPEHLVLTEMAKVGCAPPPAQADLFAALHTEARAA